VDSSSKLPTEGQHYAQQLDRSLGTFGNATLTLSAMSPATTVFVYVPVIYFVAGTWSFLATVIAGVVALGMAVVYAELGTAFPVAGGEYSMIARILGPGTGFLVFVVQLVIYVLLLAVYAVGAGQQLQAVWPSLDVRFVGLVALAIAGCLSVLNIKVGWAVTLVMLVLELVAVGTLSVLGVVHAHAPVERLLTPHAFAPDGSVGPLTWSIILMGLTLGFFNLTGFNCAVVFSEETREARRKVARALVIAVVAVLVLVGVPTAAGLLGAPSMKGLITSASPMNYLLESYSVGRLATFIDLAIFVAIFNALIANVMIFGRVLWSGSRDRVLPDPLNRWLDSVHPKSKTPWVASLVIAAIGCACIFSSALTGLVTLSGLVTIVFMSLMCIAALRVRRFRDLPEHYLMPLWPIIPVAVLVAFILMATGQTAHDLYVTLGIAAVALVYYLAYLRPRAGRRWVLLSAVEEGAAQEGSSVRSDQTLVQDEIQGTVNL